jgi:hypothetical protein
MRISEITSKTPLKPLTPDQARIQGLRKSVIRAQDQVRAERERQRKAREIKKIQGISEQQKNIPTANTSANDTLTSNQSLPSE